MPSMERSFLHAVVTTSSYNRFCETHLRFPYSFMVCQGKEFEEDAGPLSSRVSGLSMPKSHCNLLVGEPGTPWAPGRYDVVGQPSFRIHIPHVLRELSDCHYTPHALHAAACKDSLGVTNVAHADNTRSLGATDSILLPSKQPASGTEDSSPHHWTQHGR